VSDEFAHGGSARQAEPDLLNAAAFCHRSGLGERGEICSTTLCFFARSLEDTCL
jgi:hypothetical protein